MNKNTIVGIKFALFAAVISGLSIFYNKLVIVKGIDSLIFNIFKNGGVSILLTLIMLSTRRIHLLVRVSKKNWLKLLLIAIIGGSVPFVIYFEALKSVPAINANIIQKSMFIWVAMMAIPLLGERLSKIQLLGYTIVAWSNLFIGGFSGISWTRPEFMIIVATLLWSVENIIARVTLSEVDSILVAWARMFIGTVVLCGIALSQGKLLQLSYVTTEQLLMISGSIILLSGYVLFWYKALSLAPATIVTATLILATPITNILSALFVTHTFPNGQLLNFVGTILGVSCITIFTQILQKRTAPSHGQ